MTEKKADKPTLPDVKITQQTFPEAPASLNFYGVTQAGWNIQFTLRDVDEFALMNRFGNFVKQLEEWHVQPKQVGRQPEGNGNGQPPQPQQQTPASEVGTPEDYCTIHNTKMYHNKNERGEWWSHKTDDPAYPKGFCNGKPRK